MNLIIDIAHSVAIIFLAKIDQIDKEADAKIKTLQNQMKKAREGQAAKISNRIAEIKAQKSQRSAKLLQAKTLVKEALNHNVFVCHSAPVLKEKGAL